MQLRLRSTLARRRQIPETVPERSSVGAARSFRFNGCWRRPISRQSAPLSPIDAARVHLLSFSTAGCCMKLMVAVFCSAALGACAGPDLGATPFLCGSGGECPQDYYCTQGVCVRNGASLPGV